MVHGWRHSLDKWLLPIIGDVLLAEVGNAALKTIIEKMAAAGLAPQSIVTHSRVVKMVVASAVNAGANPLIRASGIMSLWGCRSLTRPNKTDLPFLAPRSKPSLPG
jgi:hypothetical protein